MLHPSIVRLTNRCAAHNAKSVTGWRHTYRRFDNCQPRILPEHRLSKTLWPETGAPGKRSAPSPPPEVTERKRTLRSQHRATAQREPSSSSSDEESDSGQEEQPRDAPKAVRGQRVERRESPKVIPYIGNALLTTLIGNPRACQSARVQ